MTAARRLLGDDHSKMVVHEHRSGPAHSATENRPPAGRVPGQRPVTADGGETTPSKIPVHGHPSPSAGAATEKSPPAGRSAASPQCDRRKYASCIPSASTNAKKPCSNIYQRCRP
ncbi:hypothetical protein F0562_032806 [Nyssa sinensis]|uniref:Uncharacterized protein n=1 Tax=Nyssa sinensis TaxID=561372 RepID=A0A5J5AP37_9ASTE|nr:hypothetical protein F0562_032806 [Nyssa sinensis]